MHLTEAIAQHVLDVHEGNNWTEVDLKHTLHDVTLAEACTLTPASPNTIASLVRHLAFWNRVMVRRAQGIGTEVGPANGFDGPGLLTDAAWQALLADLWQSGHELAAAIRAYPEAQLEAPILPAYSSSYKNLQGSVEHLHYHLGQLVLLKNLVRSQATHAHFPNVAT
ncbi:MAG: DinB family protein [Janthinobacterium lividum]